MQKFEPVIGLEIHLQLATNTKVFCGCKLEFGAKPNSRVCPVCLGLPGVLPVLNKKALEYGIKVAIALNCSISKQIKFDRKNYYYPDLPKNYQISQYEQPIGYEGYIEIPGSDPGSEQGQIQDLKKVGITRVHLEEDAGKLIHEEHGNASLVDLNRTGTPLLEIVSDPDMFSPDQAYDYLVKLKSILEYLDVSDCNMEEGSLRCDANLSLRPKGSNKLGVKTEVKNMNSFKGVRAALEYEIKRQRQVLEDGEKVTQETRLWDPDKQVTKSMRSKEEAHDYRYFPEPDLVPFRVKDEIIEDIKKSIPELPHAKAERFQKEYNLPEYDAKVLTSSKHMALYFEDINSEYPKNPKAVANWLMGDVQAYLNDNQTTVQCFMEKIDAKKLAGLIKLIDEAVISGKIAKNVLKEMISTGKNAQVIVEEKGLKQMSDTSDLEKIADEILRENPKGVEDFCAGQEKAIGFLVGKFMAKTKGKANPQMANEILRSKLEKIKREKIN